MNQLGYPIDSPKRALLRITDSAHAGSDQNTGSDQPIPGFISDGPNINVLTDCEAEGVIRSRFPAVSFTETECSYSTNETAINWNAPLVFLTAGLEQFYGWRAAN